MTGQTTVINPPRTHGRGEELRAARATLTNRLEDESAVLLLAGEPGLGRTTLLEDVARSFDAGPVLRVGAAAAESRLPYSGVHAVRCAAARTGAALPRTPRTPEGLLDLLRAAAAGGPLLLCVDDAHLWDAPSRAALGFAARRLHAAGRAGLLISVTGHRAADPDFAGLPVLRLGPLPRAAARQLLADLVPGGVDPGVREELLAEADGNPALLHALVRRLTSEELTGAAALPRPLADADVLASVVGESLSGLPAGLDDLLLTAAVAHGTAPPDGRTGVDADLVLRAAARLGGAAPPQARAERAADLIVLADGRLRFTGTLVRRAVHATASPGRRRAAHRALAAVLTADGHRLPALLHLAHSVSAPDPALAGDLARAALDPATDASRLERAAALSRAADLTPGPTLRAERRTAAAEQALLAGRPAQARGLLADAQGPDARATVRGRAELLRGVMTLGDGPVADAHASLLFARSLLAGEAPALALAATVAAADAAWSAGDLTGCLSALATASATAPEPGPGRPDPVRDYLTGMRAILEARLADAARPLRRVLDHGWTQEEPEALQRAATAALLLGEVDTACRAGARALAAARARGHEAFVPQTLEYLAYAELRAGRHARARAHAEEGLRCALHSRRRNTAAHHRAVLALAASIEGDVDEVTAQASAALATARSHGLAQTATLAEWAAGRAELGRGRPSEAAARLGPLVRPGRTGGHFAVRALVMPCFVEAAVLAARLDEARIVVEEFALWADFGADPQAPAQLARCRALLARPDDPDAADTLYRRALDLHEQSGGDFEQARTQLLYGKWLRRRRRPREARGRLRDALHIFERCGAGAWADQARAELRANGEAPAAPQDGALARLTPQQQRIARCVASGDTNREVAQRLSVSTRTVDHHLRNVFAALGVRSRVELARLVGREQ
ncbi:helix-turn-helix domain-containing protein [Streptomyces abyssomicinicus]|uniref:helix-turn-helix domain-containing protein n=1 Tax=Streptomyces abyssomicinicus TaxID=574929 RepID=UPI00124FAAF0|nr:helix-turn-helix transcriptional regulator [Streptomyces abyssomicinicus]